AEATPSALLDVSSTTQGAVVPRMTTAQRDNISVSCSCTPATGLFIYNTDCNNFNYYNGTSWQPMNTGGGNIPASAGSILGAASVCLGQSSVTYSIISVTNATSYVWSYTGTGFSIASGSGTNSITANFSAFATSGILSVYGTNACGNGSVSSGYSVTVNTPPIISNFSTPSATTVCAGSASTVTVNSTSLDNGIFTVTYNLTGANTATGSTASLTISSNTGTFSTSALANSGTTTVTITSIQNSSGCSVTVSSGNTASITVTTLPATPTATVATEITSHQLAANWGNVSGATSYALDVVTDNSFGSGFVVNNVNVGNVLTYTVTGLTAGTTYYYRVRAVNSCTNGASSNTITATTFNLANSLLAYWKLDESSGNAIDIVGGHTGTNVNTVTFSAGKINNGGNFDRTIPNYFTPTNIGAIATGSLAVWVKGSFTTDNCDYGVFATTQWNASGQPFIYVRKRDSESKVARMGYDTYGNSAEIYATSDISTSNWNYCVWIWDVPNKKVTFYLNGNQIGSPTVTTMVTPVFNDLRLGNGIITGRSFAGQLDEVGLWSKALTQNEITALYNAGNGIQYPF
ncbi:MAG: hypothetical protein HGB12_02520, partial [Bacteroidetes bacterium]|nr:hypothetical protein [Bacteroidota bacterium]